jgi:hypothetical protein
MVENALPALIAFAGSVSAPWCKKSTGAVDFLTPDF